LIRSYVPRSAGTLGVALLLATVGGVACGPSRSASEPAPARIYVTNQLDNTVSVIDGRTHKIVTTVRVGVSPAQMAVSPDHKFVYIANTGSDTVSVLDTANNTIGRTIALPRGSRPLGIAVNPNGRYLYTADGGSGGRYARACAQKKADLYFIGVGHIGTHQRRGRRSSIELSVGQTALGRDTQQQADEQPSANGAALTQAVEEDRGRTRRTAHHGALTVASTDSTPRGRSAVSSVRTKAFIFPAAVSISAR